VRWSPNLNFAFHVKRHEDPRELVDRARSLGLALSEEAASRLLVFESLLLDRAVPLGLVSGGDRDRIRDRHVLDSLRAGLAVAPGDADAYDLGSGAGLPGLVVAIAFPRLRVSLVESVRRRVAFLELAADTLGLENVTVLSGRAQTLTRPADLCFARAFASLAASWEVAVRALRHGGRLVYFAGRGFRGPVAGAEMASWRLVPTPVLESAGPLVIMARQ
jgi:16S rRNA (guanine527-N7)-methyltransferase